MTSPVDNYAVIGNPIAHSKSPEIHAAFAYNTSQKINYDRRLAPLDSFPESVSAFIKDGLKGANVTVPFKLEAFEFATHLTERARTAGAVNTLRFDGERILGDNTDGVGLVNDIVKNYGISMFGTRILLLGAGGAARGAIYPLLGECPSFLVIANRTVSKADDLVLEFSQFSNIPIRASSYADLTDEFDIIINATSTGLSDEMPPVPLGLFHEGVLALDMVYGAKPTAFMAAAAERGAAVRDGLGMLVEQAAESFFVWRGERPDTAPILADMRKQLGE